MHRLSHRRERIMIDAIDPLIGIPLAVVAWVALWFVLDTDRGSQR